LDIQTDLADFSHTNMYRYCVCVCVRARAFAKYVAKQIDRTQIIRRI
jgi:hypothetical protein